MRKTIDRGFVKDNLTKTRELLTEARHNGKELTKEDIDKMYFDVMYIMQQCSI